jgi:hypothetical protein
MNKEFFGAYIFTNFLPEKSDFNLHKRLLAKEWPKLARFPKIKINKIARFI